MLFFVVFVKWMQPSCRRNLLIAWWHSFNLYVGLQTAEAAALKAQESCKKTPLEEEGYYVCPPGNYLGTSLSKNESYFQQRHISSYHLKAFELRLCVLTGHTASDMEDRNARLRLLHAKLRNKRQPPLTRPFFPPWKQFLRPQFVVLVKDMLYNRLTSILCCRWRWGQLCTQRPWTRQLQESWLCDLRILYVVEA